MPVAPPIHFHPHLDMGYMGYLHHPEVAYHIGTQQRAQEQHPNSARYQAETAFERAFTPHNSPAPIPGAYDRHARVERDQQPGPHVLLAGHAPSIAQLENGNYSLTYTLPPGHPVLAHHGIFPEEKHKDQAPQSGPKEPTKEPDQHLEEKPISNLAQGSSQSSNSQSQKRTIDPHIYDTKYPHLVNHHLLYQHFQGGPGFGYANPYAPLFALPHSPSYQHLPQLPVHPYAPPAYAYPVLSRAHVMGYPLHPPHFYHSSQSQSNARNLNDAFIEPQASHHTRHRERLEEPHQQKEDQK
jgi:hypothetical protein